MLKLESSGGVDATAVHVTGNESIAGTKLFTGDVQLTTGQKLTIDGATAAKYWINTGFVWSLVNCPLQLDIGQSLLWSSGSVGFNSTGATTGVYLNSAGASAGSSQPGLGGTLYRGITAGNNGTTVETTLDSYSLAGSTLNTNGRGIRITAWGTFAANGNTKTVKLKFGSTDLTSGAFTGSTNSGSWTVAATILRTAAATQTATCDWGTTVGTVSRQGNVTSPGETLSGAITIALTGQSGTASNDITSAALLIEFLN